MSESKQTAMSFEEALNCIDLHDFTEWFFKRYAPKGADEYSEFHADLMALVHRIYIHAQAPLIKQMSVATALVSHLGLSETIGRIAREPDGAA